MTPKRQPLLLDPASSDLPSPLFSPRPGWGGQLRQWLHHNAYALGFRVVLLAAIILVGLSMTKNRTPQEALAPSASPAADTAYTETAARGESVSNLAARALDAYLAKSAIKLDTIQHLWAVNQLATPQDLTPGQQLTFSLTAINSAIAKAKALTASQRASLLQYLR